MKKTILLIFTIIFTQTFSQEPSGISGFVYLGELEEKHYYLSNEPAFWEEANQECASFGGHLVSINSQEENEFVLNSVLNQPVIPELTNTTSFDNAIFIGLFQNTNNPTYSEPSGGWEWTSGEVVTYTNWNLCGGIDEPSNAGCGDAACEEYGNMWLYQNGLNVCLGTWNDWTNQTTTFSEYGLHYVLESENPLEECSNLENNIFYVGIDLDNDGICDDFDNEVIITYGCTDTAACNYNSSANTDNGSCEYIEEVDLGEDITTCDESITLDAGEGYDLYSWSTGETTQTIEVSESGNYSVGVENNSNNNYSMYFDGINDYVELTDIDLLQNFTISAWFKSNSLGSYQNIVNKYVGNDTDAIGGYALLIKSSGEYYAHTNGGASYGDICVTDTYLTINQWNHISISLIDNVLIFYLNGEPIYYCNDMNNSPDTDSNTFIGRAAHGMVEWFDGFIDNVEIWDVGLTQEEILQYINCPPTGNENGLVGYWNFEEGPEGSMVIDLSGNNNNGTINGAIYSNDVPEQNCQTSPCASTGEITITFGPEGCTDELACNYDYNAICGDGSCEYIEEVDLGEDITTCDESITLDAGDGYDSYSWSTGQETQSITISDSGNYSVEVTICEPEEIEGFTYIETFDGSYYYISNTSLSWTEGNNTANLYGGNLLTISSSEEESFIVNNLMESFWYNGSDSYFTWVDLGSPNGTLPEQWDNGDIMYPGACINFDGSGTNSSEVYGLFVIDTDVNDPNCIADDEMGQAGGVLPTVIEIECYNDCLDTDEINVEFNIDGCTDPEANNYNENAACDDFSCEYWGCTDTIACNYNSEANIDDESCEYINEVDLGEDITTCDESITLDAGGGYSSYEWSTGETSQTIQVFDPGEYSVQVENNLENNTNNIYSYDFDGEKYITIDNPFYENNTNAFTINAWIYVEENGGYGESIIGNWAGPGSNTFLLSYNGAQSQISFFYTSPSPTTSVSFDLNETDFNNWIHVSVVYGEGDISLYKNSIGPQEFAENAFGQEGVPGGSNILTFGAEENLNFCTEDPNGCWFGGQVDDIQIWNIALTQEQIEEYMNCPPVGNEGGLVGYWNFDNETVNDLTNNTENIEVFGETVFSNEIPDLFCQQEFLCESLDEINVEFSINGCTDPEANNYNENVICDDGSCEYLGCTDSTADNFDPAANVDDGTCEYWGCTDFVADNFDPAANVDDGTCEYWGCTDSNSDNFDPVANVDDGSCEYLGCTDSSADNFDPTANIDNGSCEYLGCTDSTADNFDPTANIDDGGCEYWGCTDSNSDNFDPTANVDDGSCEYLGCTNPSACNFNIEANVDDGSCQLCSSREFNDGAYLDVDSEITNAQGITISFWVNDYDFCENPSDFATYIDFGSQDSYRYVIRNRSCKIEAFFEGDMLPTEFDWGPMNWGYPTASAAGSLTPNGEQAGWRQVTAVFCPTTIRIYVDGDIVASSGTGVYFENGLNLLASDIKRIGANQVDYEPANAMIDEVRVWNRALSAEEIQARSETTTTLNITEELNINGYWKMDCDSPFINEVSGALGTEGVYLTNFNENFNNNGCDTNNTYDYTCPVDLSGQADCNSCDPPEGCTDEEACNFDYLAVISIDACFYVLDYCPDLEEPQYYDCDCKCINDSDQDDVCDELEIDGCSEDENACNYNPSGTEPCIFTTDLFGFPNGLYYDCSGNCLEEFDPDGDNLCLPGEDNCPEVYNPTQIDTDGDGTGDDCDGIGLNEITTTKKLIKIVDVLGREIKEKTKKTILIYIYDNGEITPKYNF